MGRQVLNLAWTFSLLDEGTRLAGDSLSLAGTTFTGEGVPVGFRAVPSDYFGSLLGTIRRTWRDDPPAFSEELNGGPELRDDTIRASVQAWLGQVLDSTPLASIPLRAVVHDEFLTCNGPQRADGVFGVFVVDENGAIACDEEGGKPKMPLAFWIPIH